MMELRIAPHEPTSAPVMISRLFESVKPMPQAAQPGGFALSASESLGFRHAAEPTGGAEGRYRFSVNARNESILCSETLNNGRVITCYCGNFRGCGRAE